jgi:hypothetical protein
MVLFASFVAASFHPPLTASIIISAVSHCLLTMEAWFNPMPVRMWDLLWTEWQRDRFLFKYYGFTLSLSFHQCSISIYLYRVIHKSLWDFRPLRYRSWDGHAKGENVNRGRETPSFCPNLQVLEMSTLGDAADVNPVIKFLPRGLPQLWRRIVEAVAAIDLQTLQCAWQELDYRIDICRVTKGGHIEHL